jgi:hypothetical protein
MEREIQYKGHTITRLSPSGYYEFYSDKEGRFLKFDDLKGAKMAIDKENSSLSENKIRKKINLKELKTIIKRIIKEEEEKKNFYDAWVVPSDDVLKREFHVEQTLKRNRFWDDEEDFMEAIKNAKIEEITPSKNTGISYRSNTRSFDDLHSLISSYRSYPEFRNEDTLKNLYNRIKENKSLDLPIVIEFSNGRRRVFSGNTRMDVAFQLGVNPKVLIVKSSYEY